jgi:hypothetical protein
MINASSNELGAGAMLHQGPTIYVLIMPRHPFLAIELADAISIFRGQTDGNREYPFG